MDIHIPRSSICCYVLGDEEFTRFQLAKPKRYMTPYNNMFCKIIQLKQQTKSSFPMRGLIYVAKVLNVFHITTLFNKNNLPNKKYPKNHQKFTPKTHRKIQ